jgi:hypothetical protein
LAEYSAPVLYEEQREPVPRSGEVGILRVQRCEHRVAGDAVVERVDQTLEERPPADALVHRRTGVHPRER